MRTTFYRCRVCGATKKLIDLHKPYSDPPERVICGWRGCPNYAEREEEK